MLLLPEHYTKLQSILEVQLGSQDAFIDFACRHKILNKFKFSIDSKGFAYQLRSAALTSLLIKSYHEIVRLFFVNEIQMIPLKGIYFYQFSPNYAETRDTRDIDILIRQNDLDRAIKILTEAGWEVEAPSTKIREQINQHLLHAITLKHFTGVELDLHWRLAEIFHLAPSFTTDYFQSALPAAGKSLIFIPNPNLQILFLALHAYKDRWKRCYYLFDLNHLMTSTNSDFSVIDDLSRKYGMSRIYRHTIEQYQIFLSIFSETNSNLAIEKLSDLSSEIGDKEFTAYFLWSDHWAQALKKSFFRYSIPFGGDLSSNHSLLLIFIKKYLRLLGIVSRDVFARFQNRF